MAIWQFQCNIIPFRKNSHELSRDEKISWKGVPCPSCEITFLTKEKSWSKDIVQYGKIEETNIEFVYVDGVLVEIICRLDLRNLTKRTFVLLIKYVKQNNAMFLVEDIIYPPGVEAMLEVMKRSDANKYCKNPLEYFRF